MKKSVFIRLALFSALFAEEQAIYIGDKACTECQTTIWCEWQDINRSDRE